MVPSGLPKRSFRDWSRRPPIIVDQTKGAADRREEWLRLRTSGYSYAEIAAAFGVSRQRVQQVTSKIVAPARAAA